MKNAKTAARIVFLVCGAIPAIAQVLSFPSRTRVYGGKVEFPDGKLVSLALVDAAGTSLEAVTGHPFSAEQVMEHSARQSDGTYKMVLDQKAVIYRDSQGRSRTDTFLAPRSSDPEDTPPSFIEIIDPVAGYQYVLRPLTLTVGRTIWRPAEDERRDETAVARPGEKIEDLGVKELEGLTVHGTKRTITVPVGNANVTTSSEEWASAELKIFVLEKSSDSRYGDSVVSLTNISQADPDPSLFQVGEEYSAR